MKRLENNGELTRGKGNTSIFQIILPVFGACQKDQAKGIFICFKRIIISRIFDRILPIPES